MMVIRSLIPRVRSKNPYFIVPFLLLITVTTFLIFYQVFNTNYTKQHGHNDKNHIIGKCLLIIVGQTRAWELTYESLLKYVLNPYRCDLALSVGTLNENASNPMYQRAKYVFKHDFDQIGYEKALENYYYNLTNNNKQDFEHWKNRWIRFKKERKSEEFLGPLWNDKYYSVGSSGIGVINRWFTTLNILKHKLDQKYDVMVYTRSDFKYECKHYPFPFYKQNNQNNKTVWIPHGKDFGGLYDRYFISSPQQFIKINSVLKDMIISDVFYHRVNSRKYKQWKFNSEQMIRIMVEENDMELIRYPPSMYLVRSSDTFTRWSYGYYSAEENLRIKYLDERQRSATYCKPYVKGHVSLQSLMGRITMDSDGASLY